MSTNTDNTDEIVAGEESAESLELPNKGIDTSEHVDDRLTGNVKNQIGPARYFHKDTNGEPVEDWEGVFARVAKNVAITELVFIDAPPDVSKYDTKEWVSEEKKAELFDGEESTDITEEIAPYLDYGALVSRLPYDLVETMINKRSEFEDAMGEQRFMPNSPTLMNAGNELQQLSACFVREPGDAMVDADPDELRGSIMQTASDAAAIFKSGGGIGYPFHLLRPKGAIVDSTGGYSSGPMSFMQIFDEVCNTVKQGGKRRGAQMGIMHSQHPDIGRFVVSKRGEDNLSNFNISIGVTDEFFNAVENDEMYSFIDPEGGYLEPNQFDVVPHTAHFYDPEFEGAWNDEYDKPGVGYDGIAVEDNFWRDHVENMQDPEAFEEYKDQISLIPGEPMELPAGFIWQLVVDGAHHLGEPGFVNLDETNREHSFDTDEHPEHIIHSTNPSLAAGTRVLTDDGIFPIEDLEGKEDITVPTLDGEWASASCRLSGTDETLYAVELENGKTYYATKDHDWPVLRKDGRLYPNEYEKYETSEIEPGDMLSLETVDDLEYGDVGSYDDGLLVGWLYGDGSVTDRENGRRQFGFTFNEESKSNGTMDRVVGTVEDLTGSEYELNPRNRGGQDWYEMHVNHSTLVDELTQFGVEPKENGAPDQLFTEWSEEMRKGFIDGVFSTDGYVDQNNNRIVLTSAKKALVDDISDLLGFYGVTHSIKEGETELNGEIYDRWDIAIAKYASSRFADLFNLSNSKKQSALDEFDEPKQEYTSMTNSKVIDVYETDRSEKVWDLSVYDDTHTFRLSHAVTGNCAEQPLEDGEACNLGHVNLSLMVDDGAEPYDAWIQGNLPDFEDYQNNDHIKAYLDYALDTEQFESTVRTGANFLENVVTMSKFPLDEIEEQVHGKRKIGVGLMGYHQMILQMGVEYGTQESFDIAEEIMRRIDLYATEESHELALERGPFGEYEDSKWSDPTEYAEWFGKHGHKDAQDYEDGYLMRNHNVTTIAPTGTTSMIGNTTGGCEPIYNVAFFKNVGDDIQGDEMLVEFDDYFLRVLQANDLDVNAIKEEVQELMMANEFDSLSDVDSVPASIGNLFVTTEDLSVEKHIGVQSAFQHYCDSAISKTLNLKNEATIEETSDAIALALREGIKGATIYRIGSRTEEVKTTSSTGGAISLTEADDQAFLAELFERFDPEDSIDVDSELKDVDQTITVGAIEGGSVEVDEDVTPDIEIQSIQTKGGDE